MKYSTDFGLWNTVFAVPAQIVDKHLKLCGAAQLKVLLFLLRHAGGEIELAALAERVGLLPGDTQDALNYWIQAGVLSARLCEDGAALTAAPEAKPAPIVSISTVPAPAASVAAPEAEQPPHQQGAAPPHTRPGSTEIAHMLEQNSELKSLFSEAEASLGKTLTSADLSTLASLYDWAGIPVDVLLTVMEYCKQTGKTNLRYIEKVALGWQERGVDTFEKAERYIKESLEADARQKLCKTAFGIYDRALTSREAEFIKSWFCDYKFDIAIIKLAYERSIEHTGKVSFPYINKVLTNWHSQNISTPEQATKEEAAFSRQKAEQTKPKSSYDIDEFEQYLLRGSSKPE